MFPLFNFTRAVLRRVGSELDMAERKSVALHVRELVAPTADELGLKLWDVEYVKEGADYVLRSAPHVVRVFIYADEEQCIKNTAEVKGITDRKEAIKTITATDKERAAYYKAHTGREWIDARNYDLCLNSGDLGFEKCVDIITDFIKIKLG